MSIKSDKWIRKMSLSEKMISLLQIIKLEKEQYSMDFLHMDMILEYLMNIKSLLMLIIVLLIQKNLMRNHL